MWENFEFNRDLLPLILVVVNFLILYCSTVSPRHPSICKYSVPSAMPCCMLFLIGIKINMFWLFLGEQSSHREHKSIWLCITTDKWVGVARSACCSTTGRMQPFLLCNYTVLKGNINFKNISGSGENQIFFFFPHCLSGFLHIICGISVVGNSFHDVNFFILVLLRLEFWVFEKLIIKYCWFLKSGSVNTFPRQHSRL
jgi:hypothetical protein